MDTNSLDVSRVRKISTGSESSSCSDDSSVLPRYDLMNFDEMMRITDNMNTDVFENTRKFNPRKHRSCHRRAEPVSENKRKEESSKNSREYTKRNRDEIKVCQAQHNDIEAKKIRFQECLKELQIEVIEAKIREAVQIFEEIMKKHMAFGENVRKLCNIPDPEMMLFEYREQAKLADDLIFETGIESYEKKLQELHEQFAALSSTKEALNSQKDKTNYASSKSRLKQRIVRAQLKTLCWKGWKAIETMRLQGKHLKECADKLKKEIWSGVLGVYHQLLQLVKTETMSLKEKSTIDRIVKLFAPFSQMSGTLAISWQPKTEVEETNDESTNVAVKEETPMKSPSRSPLLKEVVKQEIFIEEAVTEPMITPVLPRPATLTLPTVPVPSAPRTPRTPRTPTRLLLETPTGLSPAPTKLLSFSAPVVSANTNNSGSVPAIIELCKSSELQTKSEERVNERKIEELSRKRSRSPSDSMHGEKKPKLAVEEQHSVVPRSALEMVSNTSLELQRHLVHANFMNQQILPSPILINSLAPGAAPMAPQLVPYFSPVPSPMMVSKELMQALEHQKLIQNLLRDSFSRVSKK